MVSYTLTTEEGFASIIAVQKLLREGHDPGKVSRAYVRSLERRRDPVKVAAELTEEMREGGSSARRRRRESPERDAGAGRREFFTITDLAKRWGGVSRGTVYNVLRRSGAKVVHLGPRGRRGRKVLSVAVVSEIERRMSTKLR
jgi:hypothetical protein